MPQEIDTTEIDDTDVLETEAPETGTTETKTGEKPEEWKEAVAELARSVNKATAPKEPAPVEMTEEQKAEYWGVWDPEKSNKEFYKKWFRLNPDATPEEVTEMKAMFAEMQRGLVRQSLIGARNMYSEELRKLREEFAPIREHVSAQKAEATRKRFFDAHPVLNDPKFQNVVNVVAKGLADREFKTEDEYFKALAEGAAETIKAVVPDFDLGAVATTKKPTGTTPKLPRTSVGGTGGTGAGSKVKTEVDPADIFD